MMAEGFRTDRNKHQNNQATHTQALNKKRCRSCLLAPVAKTRELDLPELVSKYLAS